MFLSARMSLHDAAGFCRRMSTQLAAGIDVRRSLEREASFKRRSRYRSEMERLLDAARGGRELSETMIEAGDYYPAVLREMVVVAEQAGRLPETLKRLADQFEFQLQMRRSFWSAVAFPLVQLGFVIVFLGGLILFMGSGLFKNLEGTDHPYDIAGLGLYGTGGFVKYCLVVGLVGAVAAAFIVAARRGLAWAAPLQKALLLIPKVGGALTSLALARLTWTMQVTLDSPMSVLKAIPICLRSSLNPFYIDPIDRITTDLRAGKGIAEAFHATGAFPDVFVESVYVGEEAGSLPEHMGILAEQYLDESRQAMVVLGRIAGFCVWAAIATFLVWRILVMAMNYINTLNNALSGF